MTSLRTFIFSFQTKLILALTAVIILAILLAGGVFVYETRDERRAQALERVVAASPAIYQQAFYALLPNVPQDGNEFRDTLDSVAQEQDLRVLVVAPNGAIVHDTEYEFGGSYIDIPQSTATDVSRGFVAWEASEEFTDQDITFVSASQRFVTGSGRELPFRIVLAVESDTLAQRWLGLLPSLGIAALIAIPLATLAGILLARQVANPVKRLTQASEAMARGDFEQRVELSREDEVGRLARSFSRMAEHVGEREAQMRALLANVSHDLKTPMTSITGYAQALADGTADQDDVARIGQVIADEAHHVNTLLADLLYLGELDAGQIITRRETVALDDVVGRCVRRIEPIARGKDIDVAVDVEPDAVLRDVDPDKLERALTNVLDNAAKFTPQGGEIVVVGRYQNGVAAPRVVCSITNSGSTIAPDDLGRVFDRFFRGDRARRTASGSGLGLAITRELVELNRGTIEASSDPSGGVTFAVSFPG